MSDERQTEQSTPPVQDSAGQPIEGNERRTVLRKLGRFASVTGPAVTLLLAVSTKPKKAVAASPTPL